MTPNLVLMRDGKKFMWDGRVYASAEEASISERAYRSDKFEVFVTEEAAQFLVYTRRVVSQTRVQ